MNMLADSGLAPNGNKKDAADFRTRLPALDGLRGIALLSVFFYHYAGSLTSHATSAPLRTLAVIFSLGWTGVDLFFVLSGFLITGILYDTLNDSKYYRKFYYRRALRIFPVYYFLAIVLASCTTLVGAHWKPAHLFFLVYLGYPAALIWTSLPHFSPVVLVTHLWSLSVEEQFYVVWPWAVARMRNSNVILGGCLILGGIALALRLFVSIAGLNPTWSYTFMFCRMDQLALGAAIAVAVRGTLRARVDHWAPFALIVAAGVVVTICGVRHTTDHNDPVIAGIGYSAIAFVYGSLLVLCLRSGSWIERFFSIGILRMFGKYSYGLYLYHFPLTVVLSPMRNGLVAWSHSFVVGGALHLIICLAANLLIAAISFHCMESPIMKLKKRFSYRVESQASSVLAPA
jgi:peptidoglycan/LPS O-acetylase OafA/YrhL